MLDYDDPPIPCHVSPVNPPAVHGPPTERDLDYLFKQVAAFGFPLAVGIDPDLTLDGLMVTWPASEASWVDPFSTAARDENCRAITCSDERLMMEVRRRARTKHIPILDAAA